MPSNTAVVYHVWSQPPKTIMASRPLIQAIATLRRVNQRVPVFVLDYSRSHSDYGPFPELLGFTVMRDLPRALGENVEDYTERGLGSLSRHLDVWAFAKQMSYDVCLYVDTDVFWLADPFPLEGDSSKMCMRFYPPAARSDGKPPLGRLRLNNGVYYFDRNSAEVARWHDEFAQLAERAFSDPEFYSGSLQAGMWNYRRFSGELVAGHMLRRGFAELYSQLPRYEHVRFIDVDDTLDVAKIKLFHSNPVVTNRIYVPLYFTELREILFSMLPRDLIVEFLYAPPVLESTPHVSLYDRRFFRFLADEHRNVLADACRAYPEASPTS